MYLILSTPIANTTLHALSLNLFFKFLSLPISILFISIILEMIMILVSKVQSNFVIIRFDLIISSGFELFQFFNPQITYLVVAKHLLIRILIFKSLLLFILNLYNF